MDSGMESQDPEKLVVELTLKLEQLRADKDSVASSLLPSPSPTSAMGAHPVPLARTDSASASLASPNPTDAPLCPPSQPVPSSSQAGTPQPGDAGPSDTLATALHAALARERILQRENAELRTAVHRTSRWREELYELRVRCGISVDELRELRGSGWDDQAFEVDDAVSPVGAGPTHGRRTSIDTTSSSQSRARYRSTSTSTRASTSSAYTTLTTPSSSYPSTRAPFTTPIGMSPATSFPSYHPLLGPAAGGHGQGFILSEDLFPTEARFSRSASSSTSTSLSPSPSSRSGSLTGSAGSGGLSRRPSASAVPSLYAVANGRGRALRT